MNDIGWAVKRVQDGQRVQRAGWSGKGMFLFYVTDWNVAFPSDVKGILPFVAMKTVGGTAVPWTCSQSDLLATDWELGPLV